jgi:hypothetical protein
MNKSGFPIKPRVDCVLKNLAPARQAALWEYVEGAGERKGHSAKQTIKWLKAQGIKAERQMLANWHTFYSLKLRFEICREMVKAFWMEINPNGPEPTQEQIQSFGNKLFAMDALDRKDDKTWARIQTLELRKEAIQTAKAKLMLEMKKYRDEQAKTKTVNADITLTAEEKRRRIRHILGTE